MENLVKADIFFFITSVSLVIFTVCMVVVMFYVIRILKDMKNISKKISEEGDKIIGDVEYLRGAVMTEGVKIKNVADFFLSLFVRRQKKEKAERMNNANRTKDSSDYKNGV